MTRRESAGRFFMGSRLRGVGDAAPYKMVCRGGIHASRAVCGSGNTHGRDESLPYCNLYTASINVSTSVKCSSIEQ